LAVGSVRGEGGGRPHIPLEVVAAGEGGDRHGAYGVNSAIRIGVIGAIGSLVGGSIGAIGWSRMARLIDVVP
jgi:hypothetical protein